MVAFLYEVEWDTVKARAHFSKHRVNFERAAEVFGDPLALTIPDDEHGITTSNSAVFCQDCARSVERKTRVTATWFVRT
jgi:uncharacterized DUF497 family protein